MILVTGATGVLGSAIVARGAQPFEMRLEDVPNVFTITRHDWDAMILCAGTKGFAECEGNRKAFRADVDGNIRLARHLLKHGTFVVFVSTDAVETALGSAYARNRFMVELAIGGLPNVAIFRPGRFTKDNVAEVAKALAHVGLNRIEGLT